MAVYSSKNKILMINFKTTQIPQIPPQKTIIMRQFLRKTRIQNHVTRSWNVVVEYYIVDRNREESICKR